MRLGIVGYGKMGALHARNARYVDGFSDLVVWDSDPKKCQLAAPHFSTCSDFTALIDNVDAAIVATPPDSHAKIACPLLRAGKHCLVEKPLALDPMTALAICEAAEQGRSLLAVGQTERFNPRLDEVLDALLPDVAEVVVRRTSSRRVDTVPWNVTMDLMVHDFDWIVRHEAAANSTDAPVILHRGTSSPTDSSCQLVYPRRRYVVSAQHSDDAPQRTVELFGAGHSLIKRLDLSLRPTAVGDDPVTRQLRAFLAYCRGESSPIATGAQSLTVLRLMAELNVGATANLELEALSA